MGSRAKELGALAVSKIVEPGLHFVGGVSGLALQVLPKGGRTWVLRATIGPRRRDMGLGGYPDVTLSDAREAARAARAKIRAGIDPIEEKKALRSALSASRKRSLTFKESAEAYIAAHEVSWRNAKHRQQWYNSLSAYAHPHLGNLLVGDIELSHIMSVLDPIWRTKTETAKRLRGRIEQILDWAIARGHRDGLNPARWKGHLDKMLAAPNKIARPKHHAALPLDEITDFVRHLRSIPGISARALEFLILTAARSGEIRGATWPEISLKDAVWTIPASRMKAGKEHRVPLSPAAITLLSDSQLSSTTDYVFESPRGGPLSDMALNAIIRRMKINAVPHGFRSTFRDWASERTNYPRDVAEMALAHTIGSKVEAAYRRGDLFEKRKFMMADWATFCTQHKPASIISLNQNEWHKTAS